MHANTAYLLHRKAFSNSSEILYYLTAEHGLLHTLAKGSKKPKSSFKGQLQSFLPSCISWQGKSSLKTLTQAEQTDVLPKVPYAYHVAMLYLNELVMLLRIDEDLYGEIHQAYANALSDLFGGQGISLVLREFEWFLCCLLGYQLPLPDTAQNDDFIIFEPQNGLVLDLQFKRCTAKEFKNFIENQPYHQKSINWLMRQMIHHITNGRPIKSRELW